MSTPLPARKRLPVDPSQEHLQKQATRLARLEGRPLAAVRQRLAQEHGARDWTELMQVVETMLRGADSPADVRAEPERLPAAVRARDVARVRTMLAAGPFTQQDLDKGLAHAAWYGGAAPGVLAVRKELFELLLDHGADPDAQYGGAYGPIVFGTGECVSPEGLSWLLAAGCDVTFAPVDTKYGRQCALSSWLGAYSRGDNDAKRRGIDLLLAHAAFVPPDVTPAVLAVHRDDPAALASAVDADPALVARRFDAMPHLDVSGVTLLHYACEFGAGGCVRLLCDRGADVNVRAAGGVTPLHLAARGATADVVVCLLDRGALPWSSDDQDRGPKHYAEQSVANPARADIVALFTDIRFGDDALRDAVAALDAGDVDGLRRLLARHARLATTRAAGGDAITRGYFTRPTLLHFVAGNPSRGAPRMPPRVLEAVDAILDAGADVDAVTGSTAGGTTLALVASSAPAHAEGLVTPLLELLVRRGADPTAGLTAAVLHRRADTARTLVRLGARHSLVSAAALGESRVLRSSLAAAAPDERLRAAWAAAIHGQTAALDALLDGGVDANARLPRPFAPTLLHEAAWSGQADVCERLLARGADPTARDTHYDGTPADWAQHGGHAELAHRLAQVRPRP